MTSRWISRRTFLKGAAALAGTIVPFGVYAGGIEPQLRLRTAHYRFTPPGWRPGLKLRLVVLSDIHACHPWMPPERVVRLCEHANSLGGDAILLLGDYMSDMPVATDDVSPEQCAAALSVLKAPLGVHAIFGNHDWWKDRDAQKQRLTETASHRALRSVGITTYSNQARRLGEGKNAFWIAGLEDQWAYRLEDRSGSVGLDNLPHTLAGVSDGAPIILLIHEPDIFPEVPQRVSLTLAGHTHGGQINLFGWTPVVPSRFGSRYVYGHKVEDGRHLIVSGGLGCSGLPIRFLSPPEILVLELGESA
ncbi:metallophosphoesterase [Oryzifoliimicrobium ureilyticus]|uniref:metallophosphoesterase n=1 Tax=Oryzifoliimicrobium ureilyticus TaxID=3113724 RepID=UPI0030765B88